MMKALVKVQEGPGHVEVREVGVPAIEDHEVLIKTRAAGFCGTDLEIVHGDFKTAIPVIMGHEGAGEVVAAGRSVTGVKTGDRVALETSKIICGACFYCRTGRYNLCSTRRGMGYGTDGTFAEYVKTNGGRVHRIPESMPFDEAGILEPLSVATRAAVQIAAVRGGDTVLVSGPGPIGLLLVQVARAAGASRIMMVGRKSRNRLQLAKELGAAHVFSAQDDAVSAIKDLTAGKGVDVFFECSGNAHAFQNLLPAVKKAGQVILVGLYPEDVPIGLNAIVTGELEVKGTWTSGVFTDWMRTIALVEAGQVRLAPLISHRFPLENWREAVQLMEQGACIKSVFVFD
jgi:L-iditol 2-dehydrogenase